MAREALDALQSAEIALGYKTYLDLIPGLLQNKTVISSGMRKEVERCQAAIEHALCGRNVALISSGDAGIYGMAGLVLEICREKRLNVLGWDEKDLNGLPGFFLRVIPGIPAFNAAASLLGAPLMHDFAAVSLSDHLTPWEVIEKRLSAAAEADFVLAIYNPRSKSRPDSLEKARLIILRHRSPETPAAIVRRAMREGQWKCVTTVGTLPVDKVDMQSVVIVGNSRTYVWNGWMVTPRGYLDKYSIAGPSAECRQD
ncbi:MAG: precorrin-3B C(17)-methyltransferase [Syntrophobacteraceae bacterium]